MAAMHQYHKASAREHAIKAASATGDPSVPGPPAATRRGVMEVDEDPGLEILRLASAAEIRGGVMDRIAVVVSIGITLVFSTGVIAGVIAMVARAIRREDRLQ